MQPYLDYAMDLYRSAMSDTWTWFATLTREEWLIVLAVISVIGFFCMRGFGSRSQY